MRIKADLMLALSQNNRKFVERVLFGNKNVYLCDICEKVIPVSEIKRFAYNGYIHYTCEDCKRSKIDSLSIC
jgi:hypothetical protein